MNSFDASRGTDTGGVIPLDQLTVSSNNVTYGHRYQPGSPLDLIATVRYLNLDPKLFSFVDLGCGKGRMLIVAAELGFSSVVGVDFGRELVEIAEANLRKVSAKNSAVIHGDATAYAYLPQNQVVYMYNPFGRQIMVKVAARLEQDRPRRTFIVYRNPKYADIFDNNSAFEFLGSLDEDVGGDPVAIWRVRERQTAKIISESGTQPLQVPLPELMITVDVEAFRRRSPEKTLDRLIWGRLDNGEGGILALMKVAEKHDVKLTTFFDYAELGMHGDELLEAAREIDRRGHDLQLHCHPEVIPDEFWAKSAVPPLRDQSTATREQAEAMVDYIVSAHARATTKDPVAYRGGAYKFNSEVLRALKESGVHLDSSYNPNGYDGQLMQRGILPQFYWSNGTLELPIAALEGFQGAKRTIEFNFNGSPFSTSESFHEFLGIFHQQKPSDVAVLVMHSWSFQVQPGAEVFDVLQPEAIERFDKFLSQIKTRVSITTARQKVQQQRRGDRVSSMIVKLSEVDFHPA